MRLAMLAPSAADVFRGRPGLVGGAERQLLALGAGLVERGHAVDVLVGGKGGEPELTPSGCRLWPGFPAGGIPLLKNLHPKGSTLWRLLRRAGSELLLQRGAADLSGIGRSVTRLLGLPFVYAVANDGDLAPGAELVPNPQDRLLYRLGAGGADLLVAQTRDQLAASRGLFGRRAVRIPSFFEPSEPVLPAYGRKILWGGNLRPVKRPEWLVAIAASLPEERFLVFGGAAAGHERYASRLIERLGALPNVDYRGHVEPERLPELFAEARILLNTSVSEGFPNTFLEAWAQGLEVVASVDPDGLLSRRSLGRLGRSPAALRQAILAAGATPTGQREERRAAARRYLAEEHDRSRLLERWERNLLRAVELSSF